MVQWVVSYGASHNVFFTDYDCEQFERALRLNGTEFTTVKWLKLADSLSKSEAERFAAKLNREDAKLRKMGGLGNNSQVDVRFDREVGAFGHVNQYYAVWVVRTYTL